MARYCIDASFLLAWLLPTGDDAARERWLAMRDTDELVAPPLLLAECTSVISKHAHGGGLDADDGRAQLENALALPIRLVHSPAQYLRAHDIARSLGVGKAYDAQYIAVAGLEGAEVLTLDHGLNGAAARLGIPATLVGAV